MVSGYDLITREVLERNCQTYKFDECIMLD